MPDRYPLLPLPAPQRDAPYRASGGGGEVSELSPVQQKHRLGHKFDRLQKASNSKDAMALGADPTSIAPERALVLEVYKSIKDFYKAAKKIKGLEFLSESEEEFQPDNVIHEISNRKKDKGQPRLDKLVAGRLYLVMPNERALRELLRLWNEWQSGVKNLGRGFAPLRKVFEHLYDIRPWGPSDRLVSETIDFLKEDLEAKPTEPCRVEVELWYSENEERRKRSFANVEAIVSNADGQIIDYVVIANICYHAALIELPASEAKQLTEEQEAEILFCDDVMFIYPQSLSDVPKIDDQDFSAASAPIGPLPDDLPPIAALLDGLPVQKHRLLSGRIDIDDPNDLETVSIVERRAHGTAMASLIIHGDRSVSSQPISRKIHICPVMVARADRESEIFHGDRLLLDVIYQAVKRMKEGDGSEDATAPDVFLVNLSLGDARRPFSGTISPWGRLLDYLADHYGILFLVSAGNISQPLTVRGFSRWTEFEDADPQVRQREILKALSERNVYRNLLSPSESLNVITVGAQHQDVVSESRGAMSVDPLESDALPNISSALGLGYRKVVKPDIYMPGGREHVHPNMSGPEFAVAPSPSGRYGLKAAAPSSKGNLDRERLSDGTSVATALATRASHLIFEALMDASRGSKHADMDPQFYPVVIRTLLVHQAKWGRSADLLEQILKNSRVGMYSRRRDNIARILGYGLPQVEAAISCTSSRATLVGYGSIPANQANIHEIPLPSSLEQVSELRSITITVAWFSPVNSRHHEYCRAKLHVDSMTDMETALGVDRVPDQPSSQSSARGTIFHVRYKGTRAIQFVDDGYVRLRITCREKAGGPLDREIHYGVAVTVEAGENIPVYEEIQTRLAAMVAPR